MVVADRNGRQKGLAYREKCDFSHDHNLTTNTATRM